MKYIKSHDDFILNEAKKFRDVDMDNQLNTLNTYYFI